MSLSRTQAARLVAEKCVAVNGEPARASRLLKRGDVVLLEWPETVARARTLTPYHHPVHVVYEDDDLLVVDKPAGLVVHPAPGHWDDTLVNALLARGTSLGGSGARPGIVHRLDKDTSGLMLIAKTEQVHRTLGAALSHRKIDRVYAALVWGHVDRAQTIDAAVARHPKDRKRMAVLATGQAARTVVEPVARFDVCDLVRCRLATGRTHQIRVHLAHIGHPVVGDPVYGGGGARRVTGAQRRPAEAIERATPRQALHAAWLILTHPTRGERIAFRSEWPEDLRPALAAASNVTDLLARPQVLEYLGFFA